MLDDLATVSGVPGMGAAVWSDGQVIWTGSTGYRDLERKLPVDDNTIFRLASVSKLLTATAAAKLHEEGKLDVDAPVTAVLPWLRAGWAPLNARQLAAHISGLPHYQDEDEGRGGKQYPNQRSAVANFEKRPLLAAPGAAYSYSSWGYTLLGAMIEQSSGTALADYVARQVTPGLAVMRDPTGTGNPDVTTPYEFIAREPVKAQAHNYSYTVGGGGMAATPAALAIFGGRLLDGKIVRPGTLDWMFEPAKLADGSSAGDEGYSVGFGWRTNLDEDGARIAHHNGIANGARSSLVLWRDGKMAVSLLTNAVWVSSIDRTARMVAAPLRPLPNGLTAAACPTKAARYAGSFNGKPIAGSVRFELARGLCTGSFEAGGELRNWLSGGMQREAGELRLVGLDSVGGLARAGLVTPYGIYDWRAQTDGSFKVTFGPTRELVVRLD